MGAVMRHGLQAWTLASCLLLVACGGGGGSSATGGTPTPAPGPSNDIGARMSASSLMIERDLYRRGGGSEKLELALLVDRAPAEGYYYRISNTDKAIVFVGNSARSDTGLDIQVQLSSPGVLGVGTYSDTVTVEVCVDSKCATPARGSPFVVPVTLKVGYFAVAEAGQPQQALSGTVALTHDLVAAAYSTSLDAIVSVSRAPSAALNVLSLASGQTRSVPLASVPTSVALSPDGRRAAVGHDAAVSLVDLVPATPGAAMPVTRFAVSLPVSAVVLDGQGRIYAFGASASSWAVMHWVDAAIGVDNLSTTNVSGLVLPVLHPAADRIYFSTRDSYPNDLYDIVLDAAGPRTGVDSPYHGDYEICGRVWTSAIATRLYTACGKTFNAATDASQDMRYAGSFAMSSPVSPGSVFVAQSVSDSQVSQQLVVLEQDRLACDPRLDQLASCYTRVGVFNATDMSLQARASLAPVTVGTDRFAQIGRYVFHRADGKAVLLTELRGAPDAAASIRLNSLP